MSSSFISMVLYGSLSVKQDNISITRYGLLSLSNYSFYDQVQKRLGVNHIKIQYIYVTLHNKIN